MKVSPAGIEAIKAHEGVRLEAYPDPATGGAPWTIGVGHTRGVQPGDRITELQAEQYLRDDLEWVERAIGQHVKVPLSQAQFDALASLIFNIGAGAFAGSTLLRKLNAGDFEGAAAEWLRWDKAGGRVMLGLSRRRAAERAMFLSGTHAPAAKENATTARAGPAPAPPDAYAQEGNMPIPLAPIIAAVLPELLRHIPILSKLSEPAQAAAVQVITEATGARNVQEAAEVVAADPAVARTAAEAVEAKWLELTEAGGGGVAGARKADAVAVTSGEPVWRSPSFLIACALLPLVYMVVGAVVGLFGAPFSEDVRAAIANGIVGLILGGLIGYYYGQTTSRNRAPAQ